MLTADLSLPRQLGLKERRKTPLFNGPLECRCSCSRSTRKPTPGKDDARSCSPVLTAD
ncbi:MAG: hypothetical protein QM674_04605 [Burkholderiaceae bacterium]